MATDRDFNQQITKTLQFEGGYNYDPNDSGGETNWGITKRSYPNLNIAGLTKNDAAVIYKRDYWRQPGIDKLPGLLAMKTFDLAVNNGTKPAIAMLQRAINHATLGDQLDVDGVIGQHTLFAANTCDEQETLQYLKSEAAIHYQKIVDYHPNDQRYLAGWLRRANA